MTAIAGLIRFDKAPIDRATLERMVNLLQPYGRDAQHTRFEPHAAFLRTLLRITPEDSLDHQPLWHAERRTLCLFDGRLDNREELAQALGIAPAELRLMADSAVALHACLRWDTECVDRLLGDFALAYWQPQARRLWLARDPLGTRPLYWHRNAAGFAFATLPKALFAIPGVRQHAASSAGLSACRRRRAGKTVHPVSRHPGRANRGALLCGQALTLHRPEEVARVLFDHLGGLLVRPGTAIRPCS
jgi:asparagine synthetase B (glutamine-hydrolysing)